METSFYRNMLFRPKTLPTELPKTMSTLFFDIVRHAVGSGRRPKNSHRLRCIDIVDLTDFWAVNGFVVGPFRSQRDGADLHFGPRTHNRFINSLLVNVDTIQRAQIAYDERTFGINSKLTVSTTNRAVIDSNVSGGTAANSDWRRHDPSRTIKSSSVVNQNKLVVHRSIPGSSSRSGPHTLERTFYNKSGGTAPILGGKTLICRLISRRAIVGVQFVLLQSGLAWRDGLDWRGRRADWNGESCGLLVSHITKFRHQLLQGLEQLIRNLRSLQR